MYGTEIMFEKLDLYPIIQVFESRQGRIWFIMLGIPVLLYLWQIAKGVGGQCEFPNIRRIWKRLLKTALVLYVFVACFHWYFLDVILPEWFYYGLPILFVVFLLVVMRIRFNEAVDSIVRSYRIKQAELDKEKERHERNFVSRMKELELKALHRESLCEEREKRVLLATVSKMPFAGLASAMADLKVVMYKECESFLRNKAHPARTAAGIVKGLRDRVKENEYQYKLMLYRYDFLMNKFPELEKYVESIDAIRSLRDYSSLSDAERDYDRVRDWLSKEEYEKLSVDERNQLALDNYIKLSKKSSWQVGRDYELYVGYLYRKEGWKVLQFGIEMSLSDMGRDIIASKGDVIHIVQCKRWSKDKLIHENVICQLYGTSIQYELEEFSNRSLTKVKIIPVLFTTTALSVTAQRFADRLGVQVRVVPMSENYPRIKCNINNGLKIYHLPFDQQYDRVQIDKNGEFYATTVREASAKGFRRAYRFMGLGIMGGGGNRV